MSSPSPEEAHYNDTNRAFLQAFLSRSVLTLKEAKPILAAIFTAHDDRETLPEDVTEADFNSYITSANRAISAFDLEIRSTYSQNDKTRIYALVNTTSDSITQLATTHTADEISFVKRVLDAMFLTNNTPRQELCAVSSMQAVRLHKNPSANSRVSNGVVELEGNGDVSVGVGAGGQGLSIVQAEKVLAGMVEEGWFERSKAGFFTLSARGLMELRGWLLETYNHGGEEEEDGEGEGDRVKLCFACREIITVLFLGGYRDNGVRVENREKKCPICKREWTGNDFVGEKVITTSERYLQGKRRSGIASSQARRSTQGGGDGAEEV
ncbi:MAG: hypothetical protein M1835_004833 [Candelina submexicana]|nr:MAG: hypothetical protein M1835_004833 [Candelina submexicana]